jgi:AcrR family transcriptional regulator
MIAMAGPAPSHEPGTQEQPAAEPRRRSRLSPDARRAELIGHARRVFGRLGYADTGLAEIADAAGVSKALLYHYFPTGRAELFAAVVDEAGAELRERLRQGADVPFSLARRIEHYFSAFFAFVDDQPTLFRLLFREPFASRDPAIEAAAVTTRVSITGDLAGLLAAAGAPADEVVATSAGLLGFAIANAELCTTGQLDAETAWRVTCVHATASIPD